MKFFFLLCTFLLLGEPATDAQLDPRTGAAILGKAGPGAEVDLSTSWDARASALVDDNGNWLAGCNAGGHLFRRYQSLSVLAGSLKL